MVGELRTERHAMASETVSLPTSVNLKPNVRFRFRNVSDRGNNTYIDDLQITGTLVNVDEVDETTLGYALYPNPTSALPAMFSSS